MDSLNTFKAAFPKYATENLQYNYLPDLPKTFWEGATANNIGKRVYDKFIDEISMLRAETLSFVFHQKVHHFVLFRDKPYPPYLAYLQKA